ncbi:Nucleotidyltransferase domain-containing protein [Streptoalloteichus tenebrarius]|uniref:Nucleotidyltransferase domain-containing protein n=1 Tax=Streptoalloteichus tenebrarius (strain ATCC 17920 / DSM 40477 / JCM 4838 / CBS 697.72 / NBRC 16177 / NCIMB 11028 / NRRL B-12390 / A12253. 1 / ISP 5477) TaxID=1933 RepID=A0ABT1I3P7_STRSD|nr:nucleotidyltransferase domain-containing protein [Streptoalloteichus tenebrarius]MCP2262397.1 Nucleotidyltransferase domain-containing protein [Streptoalloteichus tenebrarius]BFF00858.1 hypothetical protein GCM10020241_25330 [Streptoalloteichus tenebrarius]
MTDIALSPAAAEAAAEHLARLDAAAPGLVVGLHVIGSAALGDHHPAVSDLDVVAELSREPDADDLAALAAAHTGAGVHVEALYLRAGELAGPPESASTGPWANDGSLNVTDRAFLLNPVTWLQLDRHRVTVRGDEPHPPVDLAAVRAFCQENLASYWAPLLQQVAVMMGLRGDDTPVLAEGVMWIAFGPARLWHTLRTDEIVSKTRAAELASAAWPDLAGPLRELAAARAGEPVSLTREHGRAALDLGRRILAEVEVPVGPGR